MLRATSATLARLPHLARWPGVQYRIQLAQRKLRSYHSAPHEPTPSTNKVWDSVDEAIADVESGDVLLSGGASHTPLTHVQFTDNDRSDRIRAVWHTRFVSCKDLPH